MGVCMMVVKIEIRERVVTTHSLFVDGEGPFDPLEYTRSYLSRLVQDGFYLEVKSIIQKHGAEKLSNIPIENFTDFVADVLGFYKEKAES